MPGHRTETMPELSFHDHQAAFAPDLLRIESAALAALPRILAAPGGETPVLNDLPEVEISFVDDETIARVHGEFLDDPTPTDVITFHHGEILISTETALRQSTDHGNPPDRELCLYVIHGLLHLNGHEDHSEDGFQGMKATQERILEDVWPA